MTGQSIAIAEATVYTFVMAKVAYVQIKGLDKATKIEADEIVESGTVGASDWILTIKLAGKPASWEASWTISRWLVDL